MNNISRVTMDTRDIRIYLIYAARYVRRLCATQMYSVAPLCAPTEVWQGTKFIAMKSFYPRQFTGSGAMFGRSSEVYATTLPHSSRIHRDNGCRTDHWNKFLFVFVIRWLSERMADCHETINQRIFMVSVKLY